MSTNDPLPDGIPLFETARKLAGHSDDAIRQLCGSSALLVQSSDLSRPMSVGQTSSGIFAPPTAEVRVLLLPIKKQPGRNPFPYVSLGRTRNNDIIVMDATVSKFHAFFREDDGQLVVADAGSRNGTLVDAAVVATRGEGAPTALRARATLRFGSVTMTFLPFSDLKDQLRRFADGSARVLGE